MSVIVTKLNDKEEFPISRNDLEAGRLAEHSGGTIVFVGHGEKSDKNPLNIANGCGGYKEYATFRYLPHREITLVTNSEGFADRK